MGCPVVALLEDSRGNPLSVGRRRRTVPAALRRALGSRDHGCRYPGCGQARLLEAHDIRHWAEGGETDLGNLVNLCSFHHRALHEGGFRVERDGEAGLRFVSPTGAVLESAPPLRGSADALKGTRRHLGIGPDHMPLWAGDPIDYGHTVSALLLEASRSAPPVASSLTGGEGRILSCACERA